MLDLPFPVALQAQLHRTDWLLRQFLRCEMQIRTQVAVVRSVALLRIRGRVCRLVSNCSGNALNSEANNNQA